MVLRFSHILIFCLLLTVSPAAFGQAEKVEQSSKKPEAASTPVAKGQLKAVTAEQVAESSIFFYGLGGGRSTLNQIRKTTLERGTANVANTAGQLEKTTYQRYIIRGESLALDKIRLDQDFPSARYALIQADEKISLVYNNSVFTPREDVAKTFQNLIFHGIEAYLRYQENGSKLELASREKFMGVDYYLIDVTDKQDRKTRFYVSAKSFRVMMLEYEDGAVKYRRKFYDYNYAQGTLVPFRTVLWANDKIVEESEIGTVTFGQKVDEGLFSAG